MPKSQYLPPRCLQGSRRLSELQHVCKYFTLPILEAEPLLFVYCSVQPSVERHVWCCTPTRCKTIKKRKFKRNPFECLLYGGGLSGSSTFSSDSDSSGGSAHSIVSLKMTVFKSTALKWRLPQTSGSILEI